MSILPVVNLPLALRTNDDETKLVDHLVNQLSIYRATNDLKIAYYEGEQRVDNLGIAIPPAFTTLPIVVGWPGMVVDVLEERLDWYGWGSESDDFGLTDVFAANELSVESGHVHLDTLIFGTAFAVVGSGDKGEPSPLVTMHSPLHMTGLWNARTRRLEAALAIKRRDDPDYEVTLYLPDRTMSLARTGSGGAWEIVEAPDQHNLGRVPVVKFVNRPRASRLSGRSEITKAIRYYTDAAVRTMLGMEVNREFYSAPQRYVMGADESMFRGADGTVKTGWETIMGRVWALPTNEDGDNPQVGQFTPASPAPYLDQVKGLGQLLAAEAGIPPSYLGFQTDNPASADAILRSEARLVKRAERRQATFGQSWLEVARLSLLVRDGKVPDGFGGISSKWRDPATPTRSAAADEAVKLSAGDDPIIPRDSSVLYTRIGLSPAEQAQVQADKRRAQGAATIQALIQSAPPNGNGNRPA